jgi:hypothetical protein
MNLPRYLIEKVNGQWTVYDTVLVVTHEPFEDKEAAKKFVNEQQGKEKLQEK